MPDPLTTRVRAAVIGALQAINGTDPYRVDISGVVIEGDYTFENPPRSVPCVCVSPASARRTWGQPTLTGRQVDVILEVRAWTQGRSTLGETLRAAELLDADIANALHLVGLDVTSILHQAWSRSLACDTLLGGQNGVSGQGGRLAYTLTYSYALEQGETE